MDDVVDVDVKVDVEVEVEVDVDVEVETGAEASFAGRLMRRNLLATPMPHWRARRASLATGPRRRSASSLAASSCLS